MDHHQLFDDAARVQALCELDLLDTPQEPRFDRLTRLACAAFRVPVALVTLIDTDRQWFKSRTGIDVEETPRQIAFCDRVVALREPMVVTNALLDPNYCDNPLVTGEPLIRFYAGYPVYSASGYAVGTLCLIDQVAREFSAADLAQLGELAALVEQEVNRGALVRAREVAEQKLAQLHSGLELRVDERTRALRDANEALRHEISQRRELETTLRSSERRIRTIIESSFSAFVSIDAAGSIIDWNNSAQRIFGWTREEVEGRDLSDIIIPERYRAAHRAGLARMLATGEARVLNQRLELAALTRAGNEITVEMTINSFAANDAVCFGAFLHDITEREQTRRALAQKQEMLDAILDAVDVGVVACDAEGRITIFNRAARELHGLSAEALDPQDWATRYDLFDASGTSRLLSDEVPLFRAWRGETVRNAALSIVAADRPARKLLASGRQMRSANSELLGAVVALADVTELEDSRDRIEAAQQRLRTITDNLPALIGQVNRKGDFIFLNSQASRFYGKPSEELIGSSVAGVYTSTELAKLKPYFDAVLRGERTMFEDRTTVNGKDMYYQASYIPSLADDGQVDGFFAMAFDITERKHGELRMRDSEERLRLITDNLPVLIAYIDRDRKFQFANAVHETWLGIAPADMINKSVLQVLGPAYAGGPEAALGACLGGRQVEGDMDLPLAGVTRTVHSLFVPHRRGDEVIGAYILTTDVTATRLHEQQLKAMAMTDALTGLANRRSYDQHMTAAMARSTRQREGMALMYLDVDHFKAINDTLGHALGDEVLKQFATRLSASVRKTDIVCRLAGDEFTIILEGVKTAAECEVIGAKIVAAMAAPFFLGDRAWPVTASIGIAWSKSGATDAAALAAAADEALYTAKAAGRNRYALSSGP